MACKCYHAERNFVRKIGVCWGTKEREACSCGGDAAKCDFYDYVRERAKKPPTNYDLLIQKTPEEMAEWIRDQIIDRNIGIPSGIWLDWLKEEAID